MSCWPCSPPSRPTIATWRAAPRCTSRLHLAEPFDLVAARHTWLGALEEAERFARARPAEELGCLYYAPAAERFVVPRSDRSLDEQGVVLHFGTPGGVIPRVVEG